MEHTQPKPRPLAIWNPETDRWELEQETIFGHSDAYSETWPTSGMTVNGVAYELPTWEHHTADTGYSSSPPDEGLLRTPTASEVAGGMMHPDRCKAENKTLRLASQMVELANPGQLLPTPLANEAEKAWVGKRESKGQKYLSHIIGEHLLPTPRATDGTNGGPNQRGSKGDLMLPSAVHHLEPTGESTPRLFVGSEPCEEPTLPIGEIHGSETATAGSPVLGESEKDRNVLAVDRCERKQVRTRKVHEPREEFESTPVRLGGAGGSHSGRSDVGSSVQSSCVRESGSSGASDSCGECSPTGRSENPLPAGSSSSWRQPLSESENRPSDAPCVSADSRSEEQGEKTQWGIYSSAIERWEALRGTAPAPTELTAKGKHRLNAAFAEWMMGLEPGHVTGVPGLTRNEELKAIGNGVVPQQAIAALKHMLGES